MAPDNPEPQKLTPKKGFGQHFLVSDGAIRGIVPSILQACGVVLVIAGLMLNVIASRRALRPIAVQEGGD